MRCSALHQGGRAKCAAVWHVVCVYPVRCVAIPLTCTVLVVALGLFAALQASQSAQTDRLLHITRDCEYLQEYNARNLLLINIVGSALAAVVAAQPRAEFWTPEQMVTSSNIAVNTYMNRGADYVTQVALQPHGGPMQRHYRPTRRVAEFPPPPCMQYNAFDGCNVSERYQVYRTAAIQQAVNMSSGINGVYPIGMPSIALPMYLVNSSAPGAYVALLRFPVFVSNVTQDETWGWPQIGSACPDSQCFQVTDNTTGRGNKFWGFITYVWSLDFAQRAAGESVPAAAHSRGYNVVIETGFDKSSAAVRIRSPRDQELTEDAYPCLMDYLSLYPNSHYISDTYVNYNLIDPDGLTPSWLAGVIALIVIVGFLLGVLLFSIAVVWGEHQLLLFALVPEKLVMKLRQGNEIISADGKAVPIASAETPADRMLKMISDALQGRVPQVQDAVLVRAALLNSSSVYQPINLLGQLQEMHMDAEVSRALQRELQGLPDAFGARSSLLSLNSNTAGGRPNNNLMDSLRFAFTYIDGLAVSSAVLAESGSVGLGSKASQELLAAGLTGDPLGTGRSSPASIHDGRVVTMDPRTPPALLVDDLELFLAKWADQWTFDAFELRRLSNGHALSTLAFYLMHKGGLFEQLNIPRVKAARLLRHIEAGYMNNPYHNSTHAADVLQTFLVLLTHGQLIPDPVTHLACILAAAAHDLFHPGITNDFLIATGDQLAVRYNDHSPAENHHCASLFQLLQTRDLDILSTIKRPQRQRLRKMVIDLVLATDMKQHMALCSQFSAVFSVSASARASTVVSERAGSDGSVHPGHALGEVEQLLALQIALKCADIGATAESLPVASAWVDVLEQEFFLQGDKEKAEGLPVSPLFDRDKPGVSQSQPGFFEFIVLPMFSNFCAAFPATTPFLQLAASNYKAYKEVATVPKLAAGHMQDSSAGLQPSLSYISTVTGGTESAIITVKAAMDSSTKRDKSVSPV